MNVRNVLSQGYPFVQSIVAALPICKEFVISDGYSNDGTFETLKALRDKYPKIDLVRLHWETSFINTRFGEVIAKTANQTRELCSGKYLFYVQANEVVHEKSIDSIKELPSLFPYVEIFHLPYMLILGKNLVLEFQFRARLFKNIPDIAVVKDAAQVSYTYKAMLKRAIAIMLKINKKNKIYDVFTRGGMDSRLFMHAYLPKPIFRYIGLSRDAYLNKLKGHENLFKTVKASFKKDESILSTERSFQNFYKRIMADKASGLISSHIIKIPFSEHPKVMRNVLKHGVKLLE